MRPHNPARVWTKRKDGAMQYDRMLVLHGSGWWADMQVQHGYMTARMSQACVEAKCAWPDWQRERRDMHGTWLHADAAWPASLPHCMACMAACACCMACTTAWMQHACMLHCMQTLRATLHANTAWPAQLHQCVLHDRGTDLQDLLCTSV
eukprot:351032-Chlamydomonas_euryale.AAC.5